MKKKPATVYGKKGLDNVVTRDHIDNMKASPATRIEEGAPDLSSAVGREITPLPGVGATISVRAAKAHLSGLLEEVASGREVVITSDGIPKARLVPMEAGAQQKPFSGTREHLRTMPSWKGGLSAEKIIRAERDARG